MELADEMKSKSSKLMLKKCEKSSKYLDRLIVSVDGATQETYELNRVGGEFSKVYRNMEMMVKRAKKHNSNIDLMWQFIALRNNEHEIETARRMAQAIDINFFVKTFAESVPELVPRNPELRRELLLKPCTDIYRATFVFYTGEVVVCCYDLEGKYVVVEGVTIITAYHPTQKKSKRI